MVLADGDSLTGGTYTAENRDESAIEASEIVKASLSGLAVKKTSEDASSADDLSFRGVNSVVRVYGNAEVTISDCLIEASAKNATGVFAYENGVVNISDSTVTVTGGGAGGVQVAGGGTFIGSNLTSTCAFSQASTVTACKSNSWEHDWDDGVISLAATVDSTGIMTYTCADCGETERKTIPKLSDTASYSASFTLLSGAATGAKVNIYYKDQQHRHNSFKCCAYAVL